ncbi:alpha/beta fold hydrolase [Paenibacillus beijingensis]|uniref:Alpha/beta hydrolase n=1 Tax=Paenibacillus beijingensis TaxID=1126833 RepID=A0A0D5NR65_9BACL|nr:alpha/beta hydrolase [Paenibacillus beijingensis]AJY77766.1 alpha/beta hydrolase [Paenibacillus beijingensis]
MNRSIANHTLTLPGGTRLAYMDSGRGSAGRGPSRTIVLLHGYCGSSAYWEQLLPCMDKNVRMIAPDLRGHGNSSAPKADKYRIEDFAEDIAQLLDMLDPGPVLLLGHSLGGYITLAFAGHYPDRLEGFGLIHSTALPDSEEAKGNRDKAAAAIKERGMEPFVDGLVPKLFAPVHQASMAEAVQRVKEIGYGTDPGGAAASALGMKERPGRINVLEETALPVLIVAGSEDGIVPPEKAFLVERPSIARHVLEGSGHMGMIEEPQELAAIIRQFMNEPGNS